MRAQLHQEHELGRAYEEMAGFGPVWLIEYFEVRTDLRRRGVGHQALGQLSGLRPRRALAAFSAGVDEFWASAGWRACTRMDGDDYHSALFLST
ncbi:hypothetical protein ACNI3K_06830 [Demequina sp. SO4-13]